MNVYVRARHYLVRKRGRGILLACILVIALLVGLVSLTLLRSFNENLEQIGKQSQAKITVFTMDMEQRLSKEWIHKLEEVGNIDFINRVNEVMAHPNNLAISLGSHEELSEAKVRVQGFTDLSLDSLFAIDLTRLEEGGLAIEKNEILVYEPLALENGLALGDELSFQSIEGEMITAIIKGLYTYVDPHMANEDHFLSVDRFENLMFAHPEFINQLQGVTSYLEAHFYVINPSVIQETRLEFENIIGGTPFESLVNDALFRRMSQSLLQTENLIILILRVTGFAAVIITALLLTLWSKERKREVALFLSMGNSKLTIISQRLLEVFSIYSIGFGLALILANFIISPMFSFLYQSQIDLLGLETKVIALSLAEIIPVFMIGSLTLIISVCISSLSVMRLSPRRIFSTLD